MRITYHGGAADHHDFIDSHRVCFSSLFLFVSIRVVRVFVARVCDDTSSMRNELASVFFSIRTRKKP